MNVMLTRARRGVVVVADRITLWEGDASNWRPWIAWICAERSIVSRAELENVLESSSAVSLLMRGSLPSSSASSVVPSVGYGITTPAGFQSDLRSKFVGAVPKQPDVSTAAASTTPPPLRKKKPKTEDEDYAPRREVVADSWEDLFDA
eukprot:GHVT01044193.1.p1 GENE.GHVT01044193.1~~GHVT01044193.1.p1  ORF type:complete len:148 (-),score=33.78 GHVT01044193.1:86-529(-)